MTHVPSAAPRLGGSARWIAASWFALLVGGALLVVRYPELPDAIPAYRTQLGAPLRLLPKSAFSVFRISLMGLGQLGATTLMAHEARRVQHAGWLVFWVAASIAAGTKTLIESAQYALLGTLFGSTVELTFMVAALLPVLAFLALAVRLWRRGGLEPRQQMPWPRTLAVGAFLAIWLVSAALPAWVRF